MRRRITQRVGRVGLAVAILIALAVGALVLREEATHAQAPAYVLPSVVGEAFAPEQPTPFSHQVHVGEHGLPCVTCHAGGADADPPVAGRPPGSAMSFPDMWTCQYCHAGISGTRTSTAGFSAQYSAVERVTWTRVYQVLDGVTWSHAPHVDAGVACETCHGPVAAMDVMAEVAAVTAMATCISCHEAHAAPTTCETCHAWPTSEHFSRWPE